MNCIFKIIILMFFLSVVLSCQSVLYKEYQNGTIKVEYQREGFPNWSSGKQISFEIHGI